MERLVVATSNWWFWIAFILSVLSVKVFLLFTSEAMPSHYICHSHQNSGDRAEWRDQIMKFFW